VHRTIPESGPHSSTAGASAAGMDVGSAGLKRAHVPMSAGLS